VNIGEGKMLYLRHLGHTRSTLHMSNNFYFDNLFGIRRIVKEHPETKEASVSFHDDQGNEVEWEKLVDEINTRKELWAKKEINRVKNVTQLHWNVGMARQDKYPYADPESGGNRKGIPFRSTAWDRKQTRLFTIPINKDNNHWAGVVIERHAPREGCCILRYYDLYSNTNSLEDKNLRKTIMKTIGDHLNEIPEKGGESFLPPFEWQYRDVVSAADFRKNGPIQKDGHSCGFIWMMIVWFIVTKERAPNAYECRTSLWLSKEDLINFRYWLAYSILTDRVWLSPERLKCLLQFFDALEQPDAELFRKLLSISIFLKLPPPPSKIRGMELRPRS
jgi:Ulp1 protease family, C-terminal catalytic domain